MDRLAMLLAVAFSVLPVLGQFADGWPSQDEAILLVYPEQLLAGRIPHSGFFTVYGPGGFGTLAAIFAVTGPSVIVERAVGLIYHVAIAVGVVRLTSSYGTRASRAAGVTAALILWPLGLPAYAWLGGLALAIWSVALLTPTSGRRSAIFAGILGGMVAAWRVEMVVLLFAAGPLIWRTRLSKPYFTGLAVGLTPIAVFLVSTGNRVFENVIASRMAVNAQLELQTVPFLVWAGVALSLLITVALVASASRPSRRQRTAMAYAVFAALLLPQELQRIDLVHVIFVLCVIAPMGLACLLALDSDREARTVSRANPLIAVLTVLLLVLLATSAINSLRNANLSAFTHNGRSVLVSSAERQTLDALVQAITETVPAGSRVFIGASDMSVPTLSHVFLYHLLPEYRADSYFLELPPGVAEKSGSRLLNDVLGADALILTDVPRQLREALLPHMGTGVDTVNRAVIAQFCPERKVSRTTIYLRCDT